MASQPLIAASILSADFAHLAAQIAEAEEQGADWFHIDVMDGHFVPNLSLGPLIVEACRRSTSLPLDVHLMTEQPEKHIAAFADAGADHISVHVEASAHLSQTLKAIRTLGCKAGVALNPDTPADSIKSSLSDADIVLVMSVNPGKGGQAFIPDVLSKVRQLRDRLEKINSDARIEIDGGIDEHSLPEAYEAGADVFVAGTAIFGHSQGIASGIKALRDAIHIGQNH